MKKYLIACMTLLTIGAVTTETAAQKHRHHPVVVSATVTSNATVDDDEGIEAFSDTTGWDAVEQFEEDADTALTVLSINPDDYDDPFAWIRAVGQDSTVRWILLVVLLICFAVPLIFFGLLLLFIYKMRKQRLNIAQRASEGGQAIPQPAGVVPVTDEDTWRRGIKHLSIGVGVVIFGLIVSSETLAGIGAIILCYGAGQAYISKKSMRNRQDIENE